MNKKTYKNKEWLRHQYIDLEKSMYNMAKMTNRSEATIGYWVKKYGIQIRTQKEAHNTARCKQKISGEKNHFYGKHHSSESKQLISEKHKGKKLKPFTDEHKKHMSEARKGIQFSEEHKKHLSEANKGKHLSPKTRNKISEAHKGKIVSLETRKKISEALKNKPKTDEHKQKLSEARLKRKQKLGYLNSPETRKKLSEAILKRKQELGYIISPETRKVLSDSLKGKIPWNKGKTRVYSPETLKLMSDAKKGHEVSPETRNKISEANKGEKAWNWNPNREERYAPYGENFYDAQLREERWKLQNGRDLLNGNKLEWGFKSHYHHIDWNKSNDDPDNHVWVNNSTHGKVHSKRKRNYYEIILKNNLQLLKQGKIPETWKVKNKEIFRQENLVQLKLPITQIIEKEWCYGY